MKLRVWLVALALVLSFSFLLILACGDDEDDDDDDDDDDEGDQDCEDLISTIYDNCEFMLESMSAMGAYDMCADDAGPWDCIFTCADAFNVQSCSDFAACMADMCEVSTSGGGGDD